MAFACALLAIFVLSCRDHTVAPSEPAPSDPATSGFPASRERRTSEAEVPQFRRIELDQVGGDLQIQFAMDHKHTEILRYDPTRPGGWSFQLFLDTDQKPTGYWLGYDYLTRDAESDLDGRTVRVRRTIAVGPPGADGWGEETALVPVHVNRSTLTFRVPLAAVTDDDGRIDFALEMYRTSACAECPGGRSFEFSYSLSGSSDPHGRSLEVRRSGDGHRGHFKRDPDPRPRP